MDTSSFMTILGGLGLFLLGIHHLTEGLKGLAGDSLRRSLQTLVRGRLSAVVFGAVFTALIQSSSATVLTVIGFVSAGLVSFPQAIGVLIGATFGTTTTPWMVAFFGFRVQISAFAMPIIGIGAFLWLVAKGRWRAGGAILAGFGLIFVGLDYLQNGMGNVAWNIDSFVGDGWAAKWLLAGLGLVMTVVMQSSSAAAAATLVALHAGSLDFHQACAMVVGQSIGTAATSAALGAMSGGLAVRRSALAHIIFSVVVGVLGMLLLSPLAKAATWVVSGLDDYDGVLAVAAFSSLFKLMGVAVFFPWLDAYSRFIIELSGKGEESAVSRLEPALAEAGGPVALEAVWRALLEVSRGAVDAVRRRLAGEQTAYQPPEDSVRKIDHFLESLSLETLDIADMEPRLVRLCHAIDHLKRLHHDLSERAIVLATPASATAAGAQALSAWLEAQKTPADVVSGPVLQAVDAAARQLAEERMALRERILESVARQQTAAAAANEALLALQWADKALHHAWRIIDSLDAAAGRERSAGFRRRATTMLETSERSV
ncbi:MAG: Na/Pi cotransporter family protein [Hyphomicrobiales bacterium]|nr:MAG: Na/Pi cotransporter family protein [Hyphomicrobiales bacterium]